MTPTTGGKPTLEQVAHGIRTRVLAHTIEHSGGYLSQACSSAELLATLYTQLLDLGPSTEPLVPSAFGGVPRAGKLLPSGSGYNGAAHPDRDRFIFSPAHYALILYAALIEMGRLAPESLAAFNRDGSTLEMIGAEHSPGFTTTSGSLSQALSVAGGIALARRMRGDTGHVWIFMSDGEFQEGQIWEAIAALSHHRLGNLTAVVDVNGQQCDGLMTEVMTIEPLAARIRAFGGTALEVDGHDPVAIAAAARARVEGRPTFVLGSTDPCRGLDVLKQRAPLLHYVRFGSADEKNQFAAAYQELTR